MKLYSLALATIVAASATSCATTVPAPPKATCPSTSQDISLPAVVGFGSDVFVATITAQDGREDGLSGPAEIYKANVINSLSGSENGSVRVGVGSTLIDGKPCRYGIPLLEVGKTYLLATHNNMGSQVFLTPLFAGSVTELSADDVKRIGTPDEPAVVKDMREAIKSPIYPRI